jgi:hypothetical protein
MISSKPLCPCCFQAYSNDILEGGNKDTTGANNNNFEMFCGTCAPSDVEHALANKASQEKDPSVPPIVWYLTADDIAGLIVFYV